MLKLDENLRSFRVLLRKNGVLIFVQINDVVVCAMQDHFMCSKEKEMVFQKLQEKIILNFSTQSPDLFRHFEPIHIKFVFFVVSLSVISNMLGISDNSFLLKLLHLFICLCAFMYILGGACIFHGVCVFQMQSCGSQFLVFMIWTPD